MLQMHGRTMGLLCENVVLISLFYLLQGNQCGIRRDKGAACSHDCSSKVLLLIKLHNIFSFLLITMLFSIVCL